MSESNTSRVSRDSLRVSSVSPDGWEPTSGRVPIVGAQVYCTDGPAKVVRVLGRISDGSRLLGLRCAESAHSFFAAASNVLVRSASEQPSAFLDPLTAIGGEG